MNRIQLTIISLLFIAFANAQTDSTKPKKKMLPFRMLEKIQQGNLKFVPVPVFTISPERGASFGVLLNYFFKANKKKEDSLTRGSVAYLNLQYSTRKQFVSDIGYSIYTNAEKYYLQGGFGYKDFYERYWTLSDNSSRNDAYLGVEYSQLFLKGRALKNFGNQFFAGFSYNLNRISSITFESKPIPAIPAVPGIDKSFVAGIGPAISIDKRDNQFSPQKGSYVEASLRFHEKWMGSNYNYSQYNFDLRKYIPTKSKGILALNAVAAITQGSVPFLEKQKLGSDKIMRGYFSGRFRDNQFAAAQIEYRYPVGKSFVLAAFASAGQTAESLNKMELNLIQHSVGGGLRYLANRKGNLYIRMDAGYTRQKNVGFYFALGDAF
jgi:outer membrane protein assembly factor BamA